MPRPSVVDGTTRGRVPQRPEPPPPLPPIEVQRAPMGSTDMALDDVVRDMVVAFKEQLGGARVARFVDRVESPAFRHVLRFMASDLMDEGMSGRAYVRFVCGEVRRLRGRDPWPADVFSSKSFEGGLPAYRASGAAALEVPGYVATEERRRAHRERVEACRAIG